MLSAVRGAAGVAAFFAAEALGVPAVGAATVGAGAAGVVTAGAFGAGVGAWAKAVVAANAIAAAAAKVRRFIILKVSLYPVVDTHSGSMRDSRHTPAV